MATPAAPGAPNTLHVSPAAIYFQCFPSKTGPDTFRGIGGVTYVLKVNGTVQGSGTTQTDSSGKVVLSTAVVSQLQAGGSATLDIFGTTYNLTIVGAMEAVSTVKGRQRRLSMLGYELGAVDGNISARTDRAILNFQADNALLPDGVVGNHTSSKLTEVFGE